jgi:hypothetical protein
MTPKKEECEWDEDPDNEPEEASPYSINRRD